MALAHRTRGRCRGPAAPQRFGTARSAAMKALPAPAERLEAGAPRMEVARARGPGKLSRAPRSACSSDQLPRFPRSFFHLTLGIAVGHDAAASEVMALVSTHAQ